MKSWTVKGSAFGKLIFFIAVIIAVMLFTLWLGTTLWNSVIFGKLGIGNCAITMLDFFSIQVIIDCAMAIALCGIRAATKN